MVNIHLLVETQKSIADKSRPFDMGDYETCICGHVLAIACNRPLPLKYWNWAEGHPRYEGATLLGLTDEVVGRLFFADKLSREQAIARIQAVIDLTPGFTEPQPAPEEEFSPMLNVPLLRRAQATILDPNIPFDMGNWGCCIAGHIHAAIHDETPSPTRVMLVCRDMERGRLAVATGADNITDIFYDALEHHQDRVRAAFRIEMFIHTAASLPCEPNSRSSRAKAQEEVGELVGA